MSKQQTPNIRFQGFSGAWEEKTLEDLTEKIKSYSLSRNVETQKNTGFKYIHYGDIHRGIVNILDTDTILPNIQKGNFELLKTGDLVVADVSEDYEGVGATCVIDGSLTNNVVSGLHTIALRPIQANHLFLYYLFKTQAFKQYGRLIGTGTKVVGITASRLLDFKTTVPTLPEQTQIGQFFQTLDRLITQSKATLSKSRQLKKAMLAKMFPMAGETAPQIRFKGFTGAWERKKLGEIATIKTGVSNREDSDLHGEYTFFDRSQDVRRSSRYLYDCEAVIMAGEGSEFPPKYFVGKFDLHQRSYAIMDFQECKGLFIFYYLHLMNDYFYNQAVGSTVKSLRLPMFIEMPIVIPTPEEQTAIGNFFRQLDDTIALQQAELAKLTQLKKALLAVMLV